MDDHPNSQANLASSLNTFFLFLASKLWILAITKIIFYANAIESYDRTDKVQLLPISCQYCRRDLKTSMSSSSLVLKFLFSCPFLLLIFQCNCMSHDIVYGGINYKTSKAVSGKVNLSVYYEALNQSCASFIVKNLAQIFDNGLSNIVNLRLVPWGNAYFNQTSNATVCQVIFISNGFSNFFFFPIYFSREINRSICFFFPCFIFEKLRNKINFALEIFRMVQMSANWILCKPAQLIWCMMWYIVFDFIHNYLLQFYYSFSRLFHNPYYINLRWIFWYRTSILL